MTKDFLVSIIMPAYNAEKYIAEAINSVINQSYKFWELIIINDGSTDNSEDIILSFNDKRIKYFKVKHGGVSKARNIGLMNMGGEYFCFLDCDDLLPLDSLKLRLEIFRNSNDIEFVDGAIELWNKDFSDILSVKYHNYYGNPLNCLLTLDENVFFGPSWMIRRIPDKIYNFEPELTHGEDLLFYISISGSGIYSSTKNVTYKYRTGNISAMSNLIGLEHGYSIIAKRILNQKNIHKRAVTFFRRKTQLIMVKSYIRRINIVAAMRVALYGCR